MRKQIKAEVMATVEQRLEALWNNSITDKINDVMENAVQLLAAEVRSGLQKDLNDLNKDVWNNEERLKKLKRAAEDIKEQFSDSMARVEDLLKTHQWLLQTGRTLEDTLSAVPGTLAEQGTEILSLQEEVKCLRKENEELKRRFDDRLEDVRDDAESQVQEMRAVLRGLLEKLGSRAPKPPSADSAEPPQARAPEPPQTQARAASPEYVANSDMD